MTQTTINSALTGRSAFLYQDEAALKLRRAEAAIRKQAQQIGQEAGLGANVNVSTNYTVARDGNLRLTDSTITAGSNSPTAALREAKVEDASRSPSAQGLIANRKTVQFSDIVRPSLTLSSSDLANLFSNGARPLLSVNGAEAAREYVFVRGADGSYYPIGDEATLSGGSNSNNAIRIAREVTDYAQQNGANEETIRQASFNVARVYANNLQNALFGEGQIRAVA